MRSNHNILIGGAGADVFIKENKDDNEITDNIYFKTGKKTNPPIIIVRLKPIISDENDKKSLLFSVVKPEEEMIEKIHKVNPTYKWDGSKQGELKDWTLIFHKKYNTQDENEKKNVYNGKMSKLFLKLQNGTFLQISGSLDSIKKNVREKQGKEIKGDVDESTKNNNKKKNTTKKSTKKSTKKTSKNKTKKNYCKYNEKTKRCNKTENEDEDDNEKCYKIEGENGNIKCKNVEVKEEKRNDKKNNKKKEK